MEERQYLIRLKVGGSFKGKKYNYIPPSYDSLFPIRLEEFAVDYIRPVLSPTAWSLYTVLLKYDHLKMGQDTPTLDQIYEKDFFPHMTKGEFNLALLMLSNTQVNDIDLIDLNITLDDSTPADYE